MAQGERVDLAPRDPVELAQIHASAACAGTDPFLFYPPTGARSAARAAKRVCMGCPVQARCLRYALTHRERFGVWGGLSERERRELKRQISAGRSIEPVLRKLEEANT